MKAVVQRVKEASVNIKQREASPVRNRRFSNGASSEQQIGRGLVILLGVGKDDSGDEVKWLAEKILNLRIFPGQNNKMNLSVQNIKGEILVVPQFTLYGDCWKGRRPDFASAAPPELAKSLYFQFVGELNKSGLVVKSGEFGAEMLVDIHNDGPVTFVIEN